jgi:hypothetical protein
LALTPVWEGDALINWRWSTRAPMSGHINPVESPEDPGHTNKMALGSRTAPRRQRSPSSGVPARSVARQGTGGHLLSNNSDHIVDLEYGLLPTSETSRVKAAQGIVRLAIKEVLGSLH